MLLVTRLFEEFLDERADFVVVGVAAGFLLRIDELITNDDLEYTTPRWDQSEVVDLVLEFFEYVASHAHGTVAIPSNRAVFDAQFHVAMVGGGAVRACRQESETEELLGYGLV